MNTTYESQRKERLSDVIFDYLQDEDTSPEKLYTDIREEIINALEHFEKYADRCRRARDLITDDFFPTNSDYKEHCYYDSESEGRDFYSNDTHPEISPPDLTDARIQATSPFNDGWTQEFYREQISRNDPNRIDYKDPWVYESPDGGKTITKRKPGSLEKYPITRDEINEHYKNLGNAD